MHSTCPFSYVMSTFGLRFTDVRMSVSDFNMLPFENSSIQYLHIFLTTVRMYMCGCVGLSFWKDNAFVCACVLRLFTVSRLYGNSYMNCSSWLRAGIYLRISFRFFLTLAHKELGEAVYEGPKTWKRVDFFNRSTIFFYFVSFPVDVVCCCLLVVAWTQRTVGQEDLNKPEHLWMSKNDMFGVWHRPDTRNDIKAMQITVLDDKVFAIVCRYSAKLCIQPFAALSGKTITFDDHIRVKEVASNAPVLHF